MAGIRIREFFGEIPKRARTLLPPGYAEIARGVRLEDGSLKPFREPVVVATVDPDVATIFKDGDEWMSWEVPVHVERGPVAQDRLYWTGDGAPKMKVDGAVYPLALHPPEAKLTATAINRQEPPELNDPDAPITAPNDSAPSPGPPRTLKVLRQPEGGLSGQALVTQPAIGLYDDNNNLCHNLSGFEVTVRVSGETGGFMTGPRTQQSVGGIVRFRDLTVAQEAEEPTILEFTAGEIIPVSSEEIYVDPDLNEMAKDVLFTYTFVTEFDEESAPAPVSDPFSWYPGLEVDLTGFSTPQSDRAVDRVRVYRSETSALGVTDLYFVKEVAWSEIEAGGDVIYLDSDNPLAEILPSNDYDPIPDDYEGLISMPNGMMAAFRGREIAFCEPFIPHAWPEKYRLKIESEIMGLVSFGSSVAVITRNTPYIAQGFAPEAMRLEKIEQAMPCVSKESIVDLGYAAAFATNRGIAVLGQGQGAQIITSSLFTVDQWQDMQPESISAVRYRDQYTFCFRHINGSEHDGTYFIDLSGSTPHVSRIGFLSRVLFASPETGKVFYTYDGAILEFDSRRSRPLPYVWTSGCYMLPALVNFGAIMVRTDAQSDRHNRSISVHVYADDRKIMTIRNADKPERLPGNFLSDKWQVSVEGTMEVVDVAIAGSIDELMEV